MDVRARIDAYSMVQEEVNNTQRHRRRRFHPYVNSVLLDGFITRLDRFILTTQSESIPEPDYTEQMYEEEDEEKCTTLAQLNASSKLMTYPSTKILTDTCFICIAEFRIGDIVRVLKCRHAFCHTCIDKWLTVSISCPVCRRELA